MGKPRRPDGNDMEDDVSLSSSLEIFFREMKKFPVLSRAQELEIAMKVKEGDLNAREILINSNLRFVVKVAFQYRKYGLPLEDLISVGLQAMVEAIDKFEPQHGYRFISYAVWLIKGRIQYYIIKNKVIGPGLGVQNMRSYLFGKNSAVEFFPDVYLDDSPYNDADSNSSYHDVLAGEYKTDVFEEEERNSLIRFIVNEIAGNFNERERVILYERLMTDDSLTLEAIGGRFSVGRERVRQIEVGLINKIRRDFAELGFVSLKGMETLDKE